MEKMTIQQGDVLEICTSKYGNIKAYIIDEIKDTMRDLEHPIAIRNSKYLLVREIDEIDNLKESGNEQGHIVWRLEK